MPQGLKRVEEQAVLIWGMDTQRQVWSRGAGSKSEMCEAGIAVEAAIPTDPACCSARKLQDAFVLNALILHQRIKAFNSLGSK